MSTKIRIVLAQLNLPVGDIAGNLQKHMTAAITARDKLKADVIVFPELSLTGYPPEDLLLRKAFVAEAMAALNKFKSEIKNIYCLVGHPYSDNHHLFNACSLVYNGNIVAQYSKQKLPNYGIFDECRYFTAGTQSCVCRFMNCQPVSLFVKIYGSLGTTSDAAALGARIILAPNASPFESDKHEQRLSVLAKRAKHDKLAIVYVNHVGGQDDLIFDGGSMVVDDQGKLAQFAGFFNETLLPVDIETQGSPKIISTNANTDIPFRDARIYQALVLSLRDYIEKNHFPGVLVGVSGGIDSALTLAIAVDALGKERVHAVMMPSRFTSDISMEDAKALVESLGVSSEIISIEPICVTLFLNLSASLLIKTDVTEEIFRRVAVRLS